MEGASRESFAAARDRLAAVASGADAEQVSSDLRAVARLLSREPGLRRALSDPAQPARSRSELLTSLLGGKVSDAALQVLQTAVEGRWSSSSDLLDAVELFAVEADLAVAEADGSLADVEDALFRFGRIVEASPRLAVLLSDPTVEADRRVELVQSLLGGKTTPVAARLAETAVYGLGGRSFDASLRRLVELTAARRDRQVAYVRVAAPLSEQQEDRLAARLAAIYGRQISLQVVVDRSVIGGASVQIGDDLYDGTVSRRLELARSALSA
ncbi:MAG: F-type H+-transporting ATPase subunit delta [Cryptosporangiaceae bacterium]|jgi:F-type H+-transporting ATPase subunit delta|nr:F-type H+-transporting ATPase subunit delta [Cryptosporangiaceae bacterium]